MKKQVYHKQFTRKNRVGCDIKYLGAPSCLAYAGSFVVYSQPPPLEPHLRASFSRHRAKKICHRGNIYLPAPSLIPKATFPLFLLAFQVQTFTAASWQLSLLAGDPSSCSSASSPTTLLLAAPPPRRWPFFLQRRLLAGDPSSCRAASSPPTLLLATRPHRYGQVIHTPPTPSSSFPVPHAPTDGATPSIEITAALLQLSAAHNHFTLSITWSSVACGRMRAQGLYGCHACRPPDLGGAPRLRGHHRHRHAVVYFKIQFILFSRGHR